MELMRQQAKNFGTRIITDDIVEVDFKVHPFRLRASEGEWLTAKAVIVATGAGQLSRPAVGRSIQESRRQRLRGL